MKIKLPKIIKKNWPIILIIALSFILLGKNLNKPFIGYHDWNSVVYGRSAKSIIGQSDLPGLYFQTHYPPLLPVFLGASFFIFGVNETAARAVPFLAMSATALMIYFLGLKLWSKKEALAAALFFLFTPLVRYFAKIPVHETILPFFIVGQFYFYWQWFKTGKIKYYWWLIVFFVIAQFIGWPGYYSVAWLSLHYLIFKKKRNYKLILNWWLLAFLMFALFFLFNLLVCGSGFLSGLWNIFLFRANLSDNSIGFSFKEFAGKELLWMRVYFTRILFFLTILWGLINIVKVIKKKNLDEKTAFLLFLALSGFIHLLFFILVWFHDYMIIYLAPFVVLTAARTLMVISKKIRFNYCILVFLIIIGMYFESKDFLNALNKRNVFLPAKILGEEIKKNSKPGEVYLIGSRESGKIYGVYLEYYADRIHENGEPTFDEFIKNEKDFRKKYRYFVIDTAHNYLGQDLVDYLLKNYKWHQKDEFQIIDLKL